MPYEFFSWIKNKLISIIQAIKSRVLGSMRVQRDNGIVSFSFPKNITEELATPAIRGGMAAMTGYLFESECYFALVNKGLKDLTERFNTELYKKQKDALADVYVDIVNAARELADAMYNAATKSIGHIDSVKYLGGAVGSGPRGDTADIQLSSVGYSLKYKKRSEDSLNLANMSVKNAMRLFGIDVDKNDPDILNKIKESFEKAATPEKFAQLVNYFTTGGGNTYLASYQVGQGARIGHPEIFSNNFDVVNHELRGKSDARVTTNLRLKKIRPTNEAVARREYRENDMFDVYLTYVHQNTIELQFSFNLNKWVTTVKLSWK